MTIEAIDIQQILKRIPHRYPLLLVDRVIEIEVPKKIVAIKNVTFNEPFFMGHFPEKPIMPGVLIIEAMAQASAILVTETLGKEGAKNKLVYFMSIDEAKFRKIVTPGDQILMEINLLKNRSNVWKFSATSKVSDKIVAEAIFSAMMVDSHE